MIASEGFLEFNDISFKVKVKQNMHCNSYLVITVWTLQTNIYMFAINTQKVVVTDR